MVPGAVTIGKPETSEPIEGLVAQKTGGEASREEVVLGVKRRTL